VPTAWSIELTGDYNLDFKSDILWRCTVTTPGVCTAGNAAIWFMNGIQVASAAGVENIPTSLAIQSVNAE
jgi:hypothetical protein